MPVKPAASEAKVLGKTQISIEIKGVVKISPVILKRFGPEKIGLDMSEAKVSSIGPGFVKWADKALDTGTLEIGCFGEGSVLEIAPEK